MVQVLILAGYGLNCEEETRFAFEQAGAKGTIVHINDLIESPAQLRNYQTLVFPGGFSYGDDTGSGNAFANRVKNNLWDEVQTFIARDTLTIGICNGCQILVRLGVMGDDVALTHNSSGRYQCRWVDLKVQDTETPWLKNIDTMHIPVAHGEGNFVFNKESADNRLALQYVTPEGKAANGAYPYNPNGAEKDCAALTSHNGRVLAMMPHPERAMFFHQREDYAQLKEQYLRQGKTLPETGDGITLFNNAVAYFK